jgi:molecular chaperone GrpE
VFKRKKMNEKERDEATEQTIPFNDKRRFDENGERFAEEERTKNVEPAMSPKELALESSLKTETDRRVAAEAKLVGVQAKFEEAKAELERETAEMRTRLMKTLEDRSKQAQISFLTTLLPVLDNLNLAIAASETDPSIENLRSGVVGTARSFERALIDVGVEAIGAIGEKFDPEVHEAVDMVPSDIENDGRIIAEYSRGYKFGDRLLRPARVQVGRAMAAPAGD